MTYAQTLWLYTVLLFGIIIVPGMDMFFVMANGLSGGKSRGLAATFGVMAGGNSGAAIAATYPDLVNLSTGAVYYVFSL